MAGVEKVEDLVIWQKAMGLCEKVYDLTKDFPKHELYGITSQMRRSAVSIPSNIAEGFARRSKNEFKQFLSIASGSLSELKTQTLIAERIRYISNTAIKELTGEMRVLGKQISAMFSNIR